MLLNYLDNTGRSSIALIIRVLTTTGMRLGELLSLELSQVEDEWIRLWETKTNRPRSVPLPSGMGAQLRLLIESGIPTGPKIRKALSEALRACGVNSRITPHSLRHTTGTRLAKAGVNLLVVSKYLGHNSLKTTQRYVHIDDSDISAALIKMNH